jgi:hypothetical protein
MAASIGCDSRQASSVRGRRATLGLRAANFRGNPIAANCRISNMNEPVIFSESDAMCAMLGLPVEDASYKTAQPDNLTFD